MNRPTVYLVGAGPGDPGLLTVAAADALRAARVVVYDYLANPQLLDLAPSTAQRIYVGKSAGQHTRTQDQINEILVECAQRLAQDRTAPSGDDPIIVRLKGGDPFVFGRGGEEAEYLRRHDIPFIIIPGITSGIAAPTYAGIPITHRDFASTITLITGHQRDDAPAPVPPAGVAEEGSEALIGNVNYPALAQLDGTLVFYMGVKALPSIANRLIAAGMSPQTPAAVIRWGTYPHQQTVTGTLRTLPALVTAAGINPPAITVVGKVVALRDSLNWFESRPLFGQRILVTRTRQQASELSALLSARGAQVLEAPTIEVIAPPDDQWPAIDEALLRIPSFDWVVFTSVNGVRAAWQRLRHLRRDARHFAGPRVAAVGTATAEALAQVGIIADLLPDRFTGEELAATLAGEMRSTSAPRILLLRADIARPVLRRELEARGARVDDVAIYQTVRPAALPENVLDVLNGAAPLAWVTFTSASTATNLWELLTPRQRQAVAAARRASIGPVTSAALRALGDGQWAPTVQADPHTLEALVESLLRAGAAP